MSSFWIKLLQNLDYVCTERDFEGGIKCCYSEKNAVSSQQLAGLRKKIIFHGGVPDEDFYKNAKGRPNLLLIEDLLHSVYTDHVSVFLLEATITEISV
jgi:hypothetical protein